MRNIFLVLLLSLTLPLLAQQRKYSTFYEQRVSLFELLPSAENDILFIGNSISNGAEWFELFDNKQVKNRGISGDIIMGVYDRLAPVIKGKPSKIFLMIGINDIARNTSLDTLVLHFTKVVDKIQQQLPNTKLYLQSVLPVNPDFGMFAGHTSKATIIKQFNMSIQLLAKQKQLVYIDLYSKFIEDSTSKLAPKYTNDGLHLTGEGYILWRNLLLPYIND